MSDLAATNCGCGCDNNGCNNGCGCSNWIWIILLLACCGNGNGCGSGYGFGNRASARECAKTHSFLSCVCIPVRHCLGLAYEILTMRHVLHVRGSAEAAASTAIAATAA